MKLTLDKALSLVAVGVISAISSAQAAPVYEIINLDLDTYDLRGTIEGTRNGYAMGVDENNELIGISKGKKKLDTDDVDDGIIDVEDGIAPSESITYSIYLPIVANNFTFTAAENAAEGAYKPEFFSIAGTTNPTDTDDEGELIINSVDTYFYGMNSNGIKVGAYTAPEKTMEYEGTLEDQEFWFYRDFEFRGVAVSTSGDVDAELALIPPYTTFSREEDGDKPAATVELGGWSAAAAVNENNIAVGYGSTELASFSDDIVNNCIDNYDPEAENPVPVDICIQANQYPVNSRRNIQYQTRALVWDLNVAQGETPAVTELPLGLTPPDDSTLVFTAQGLGINANGDVVGRSHTYRNGDTNKLRQDAAFWRKDADGNYQYNWVNFGTDDVLSSIAHDINDDGLMVGSYQRYLSGYLRTKFFILDTKDESATPITPEDFLTGGTSDLSSTPKDINNKGQVVGHIEVTYDREKPRPKAGFLYDNNTKEFVNLNSQLVCESKGYVADGDSWTRNQVKIKDGSGEELSYGSEIYVVEANSINEDGTIVGTAFIRKPSYQLDDDGNLVVNENGEPYFALDGNGNPVTSYLPRMVVLKPTSGEACTYSDLPEEKPYERKGAASWAWLFALPLLWFRRRKQV